MRSCILLNEIMHVTNAIYNYQKIYIITQSIITQYIITQSIIIQSFITQSMKIKHCSVILVYWYIW